MSDSGMHRKHLSTAGTYSGQVEVFDLSFSFFITVMPSLNICLFNQLQTIYNFHCGRFRVLICKLLKNYTSIKSTFLLRIRVSICFTCVKFWNAQIGNRCKWNTLEVRAILNFIWYLKTKMHAFSELDRPNQGCIR